MEDTQQKETKEFSPHPQIGDPGLEGKKKKNRLAKVKWIAGKKAKNLEKPSKIAEKFSPCSK